MIARANRALESLELAWRRGEVDDFAAFLDGRELSDGELAELIEVDARARLARAQPVTLDRYVPAIHGLTGMPIALDAAIEFSLRSLSGSSRPTAEAIDELVRRLPSLESSIRNAAALSAGLASTHTLRRLDTATLAEHTGPSRVLPSSFGPRMADGCTRYELLEWLGGGSQGEVYRAIDRAMSHPDRPAIVAIKLLQTGALSDQERWLAAEEATRARRVTHDNVVRAMDRGVADTGDEYIVYEYIDGGNLTTWLPDQQTNPRAIASLIAKVARGVQAAHQAGLVHRDLKPSNILLTRDGTPKVTDFGTAALVDEPPPDMEGARVGNLAFIAPEQYRREFGAHSSQVDVYALGGILFHGLTGRLPHGWTPESVDRNLATAGGTRRHLPDFSGVPIDGDLKRIVSRALAERPADRYASADALASDLEAWVNHEPIRWMQPSVARRARLLIRRAPRQVALASAAIAVVLIATVLSTAVFVRARERVRAAEIERVTAKAYAEATQRKQSDFADQFHQVQQIMVRNRDLEPSDWFPTVTILESLMGPYFFGPEQVARQVWDDRIVVGERIISEAEINGWSDSVETLLWRDLVTYWLLRTVRPDRALACAAAADPAWEAKLAPDDPWRLVRAGLRSIGVIQQKVEAAAKTGERAGADPELVRAGESLRALEEYLERTKHGDALHTFVVETLVKLYGERMLNQSADFEAFRAKRAKLKGEAFYEEHDLMVRPDGTRRKLRSIWE